MQAFKYSALLFITLLLSGCLGKAVDVVGHTASGALSLTTSAIAFVLP